MPFSTKNLTFLDIEISSSCNAYCLECNRLVEIGDEKFVVNPWHQFLNKHYPVEKFKKHISQFGQPNEVVLCGNSGDPMAHPAMDQIAILLRQQFPYSYIEIETNGSLGKLSTFKIIAEQDIWIKFSIDGLEDTNHIYRRNVKWNSVMDNARYFISQGGKAIWDTIDFVHSAHQLDDMKQLADQMGFSKFEITKRFSPDLDETIVKLANEVPQKVDENFSMNKIPLKYNNNWFENNFIIPKCLKDNGKKQYLYLESNGTVWPCCTTAQIVYHPNEPDYKKWQDYCEKYGEDWNNLNKYSLDQILASGFFNKDLENSWQSNHCLETCMSTCGAKISQISSVPS